VAEKWAIATRQSRCPQCHKQIEPGEDIWRKSAGITYCQLCGSAAEHEPRVTGPQEDSVEDFLSALPPEAKKHPLAAAMVKLAQQIDDGDVPPREMTLYTKEIRLNLMQMRELFPEHEEDDPTETARLSRERRMRESSGI